MQEKQPNLAENFSEEVLCANLGLKEKYSTLLKLLRWQKGGSAFTGRADIPRQMHPAKTSQRTLPAMHYTYSCVHRGHLERPGVAFRCEGAREIIPKFLRLPVWVPKIQPLLVLSTIVRIIHTLKVPENVN